MTRNQKILAQLAVAVAGLMLITIASAQEENLGGAVTSGKAHVALRYRYEYVDQDSFLLDANASTLRIRLNYQTGDWKNWSAFWIPPGPRSPTATVVRWSTSGAKADS